MNHGGMIARVRDHRDVMSSPMTPRQLENRRTPKQLSSSGSDSAEVDPGTVSDIEGPPEGEFEELLSLARDRNQDAIHDLWVRFDYDFLANNNRGRARV